MKNAPPEAGRFNYLISTGQRFLRPLLDDEDFEPPPDFFDPPERVVDPELLVRGDDGAALVVPDDLDFPDVDRVAPDELPLLDFGRDFTVPDDEPRDLVPDDPLVVPELFVRTRLVVVVPEEEPLVRLRVV